MDVDVDAGGNIEKRILIDDSAGGAPANANAAQPTAGQQTVNPSGVQESGAGAVDNKFDV